MQNKKIISTLLLIVVCLTCLIVLSACKHTHKYTTQTVKATCTQDGATVYTCECGETNSKPIPATGHSGGIATCTKKRVCSTCREEYGETLKHNYNNLKNTETEHWYQCVCGDIADRGEHIPSDPATETEAQVCTVCDYELAPALGHIHAWHLTKVVAKDSTCTEKGNTTYYKCSCGDYFADQDATTEITNKASVEIAVKNHAYQNGNCNLCGMTSDSYFNFVKLDSGTYEVKAKNVGNMPENIIIPSVYNGTSVTQIASQGFKNCIKLKKVTISKGIKTIANEAFSGCENLEEVILPNSLSTIGMLAFTGTKISEIVLPNSIRIIADFAFAGCDHLTTLIIDIGLHSIGMGAFKGTRISKIYYKGPESIWSQISVGEENELFLNSDCYFYSENKPTKQGNYWHYDEDGKTPVIWSNED